MEHTTHIGSSKRPRGYRRGLLMVLAFVYLFVGIAHNVVCLDEAIASSFGIETIAVADASHGGDKKTDIAACDHCPTCVPAVMPVPVMAAEPFGLPSSRDIPVAALLRADHAWLDKPPPKTLT